MTGAGQTAGDKRRAYVGPAFFSHGFRPFFFSAALFAGLAVPVWMAAFSHGYAVGPQGNALGWHGHEMIFGYVAAVIAGFVMTAIPNWTGRLPVMGIPLMLLFLLWLAGRVAMFVGGNSLLIGTIDCLFLIAVTGLAWREVIAGRNWRNLPVCVVIAFLALANILDHVGVAVGLPPQFGLRMALALIASLMMLIGGRVIPSFTTNWMKKMGVAALPASFGFYDKIALLVAVVALLGWIVFPDARAVGAGFLIAAIFHVVRLVRWRGWYCCKDPLVLVLHIAYFWIPVAFGSMGLAILRPDILTSPQALHALTAGAMGQLTLAIMTRASLGHCGRDLRAGTGTGLIYLLVFSGGLLRVLLPFTEFNYALGMSIAGIIWASGFLLFAALYGPMLFAPRK